jgi:hypothetical protein
VKKAVLAAAVAAAAVAGVIIAIVVSSGSGGTASPPRRETSTGPSTTSKTTPAGLIVGTADDALAQADPRFAQHQVDVSHAAGFDAAVVSAMWQKGQRRPPASLFHVLSNVARATKRRDMHLFVMVWHGLARDTPTTPSDRADFAAYAAALVQSLPAVRGVIIGNEPNLSTFWKPQFGADGRDLAADDYEDLLARSYDAVKGVDNSVLVLGGALSPRGADRAGGARPTHSPTAFIRDLGTAYRASGRSKPLMDAFAFHPYMQASRLPPTQAHPENTSITIADYPKLVALLNEAFHGTAQPGAALPIYYTEFGVQTRVPAAKLRFYNNVATPARSDSVPFALQAAYYRRALQLAYCQPTVRGLFVFHTFDEENLGGWQSGLYFADGTPKPSLAPFRRAVADLRGGKFPACPR